MLSPYENIIIGNFLYGLGLAIGKRPKEVEGCVNLLQQTPLDKALGDVMLQFPGAWRLIEFKRVGANLTKEKVKLHTYRGATRRDQDLRRASLRTHWFVETGQHLIDELGNSEFRMMVRPYLELEEHGGITLEAFAEQVVDDARHGTVRQKELDLYLRLIRLFGCLDGYETSGLLVGVSSAGGLVYLPLDDIADLNATANLLRARLRAREAELNAKRAAHRAFSAAIEERRRHLQEPIQQPTRERQRSPEIELSR